MGALALEPNSGTLPLPRKATPTASVLRGGEMRRRLARCLHSSITRRYTIMHPSLDPFRNVSSVS
jgi:hypothetical protein